MSTTPRRRPTGLTWLAILCAAFGVQSLTNSMVMSPEWLASARAGHPADMSFVWVQLLSGVSGLASAYGLWRRRRWARLTFLVMVVLVIAAVALITMFGVGEIGGRLAWTVGIFLVGGTVALAAALTRYVWSLT